MLNDFKRHERRTRSPDHNTDGRTNRIEVESITWDLLGQQPGDYDCGWAGWCQNGDLHVRLHGDKIEAIGRRLEHHLESVITNGGSIRVVSRKVEARPLPPTVYGIIQWGTVLRQKLTKRIFEALPSGHAGIVSNVLAADGSPVFADWIGPMKGTWKRIKETGVEGRLFRLVWTELDLNFRQRPQMPSSRI